MKDQAWDGRQRITIKDENRRVAMRVPRSYDKPLTSCTAAKILKVVPWTRTSHFGFQD